MELPNDIASCHRIILELASIIEGFEPRLKGYIQQIEAQRDQIEGQCDQIGHLELWVKELESQTKQNSRNSSRPPSSDMYRQKPAFPRVKGGKVGGKEGHDGGTLKMVPAPDVIIEHRFIQQCLQYPPAIQVEAWEIVLIEWASCCTFPEGAAIICSRE